jgi:ATP-dependent DNA helicase RecG
VTQVGNPLDERLVRVLGDRGAKKLTKAFGYETVGDLLAHFPRRYFGRGDLTDLSTLSVGDEVTVLAEVAKVESRPMRERKGKLVKVTITDSRSTLELTFFNQRWPLSRLVPGRKGLFAGVVGEYRGARQLTHPHFAMFSEDKDGASSSVDRDLELFEAVAGRLIPIYPATASTSSWNIAKAIKVVVDSLPELEDPIPVEIRAREGLLELRDAYRLIHFPADQHDVNRALDRFRYQEALVLQSVLAKRRHAIRGLSAVPRRPTPEGLLASFDARLPFTLTVGQREVAATIAEDMAREFPMHRLLQGEVGSGKTVVALRAMLTVVDTGGQAALLAPTEVLAQQHARSIRAMLGPLAEAGMLGGEAHGTRVALLTGSQSAATRRKMLLDISSGDAGIVVGTHALLQEHVDFFDLGLVVVDEQHRFGVEQRDALRAKGRQPPHVLVMTATPIPRTVAMTVFGDLEVSTLTELPAGRSSITTHVVPAAERPRYLERTWERVREEVESGNQVYVVCPRIGEAASDEDVGADAPDDERAQSSALGAQSVLELTPRLADGPLAGLNVESMHGRMSSEAKEETMRRFGAGDTDVLVSTTVIEVGVDVPSATLMVVMEADRFGVSQLHQLRGRVGRGTEPGLCLLVSDAPEHSPARERLDAVASTLDGFALSRLDLEQRREGDVLGSSQSGFRSGLRVLRVLRDEDVIAKARQDATDIVEADPELESVPALHRAVWEVLADERAEFLEKT